MRQPKVDHLGGGGLDGRNSTPMGCLTGSGVIFTRGLGGGGLTCFHGKKILKQSSGLIFEFNFSFNI